MVLPQQKNPLGRLKLDSSNMFQSLETSSGPSPVPFNPTSQPKQMQIQNAPVDHRIQNSEMWIFYRKGLGDMMWVGKDYRVWVWPKVSKYSLLLSCPTSLKPHPPWLNLPQNLISLSDLPVWCYRNSYHIWELLASSDFVCKNRKLQSYGWSRFGYQCDLPKDHTGLVSELISILRSRLLKSKSWWRKFCRRKKLFRDWIWKVEKIK